MAHQSISLSLLSFRNSKLSSTFFSPSPHVMRRSFRRSFISIPACALCTKPEPAFPRAISFAMLSILAFYKKHITEFLPPNCRFVPTCSTYMVEAITTYGAWKGFILSSWRVIRCNPFGGSGYDPVMWPPVGFRAGS